MPQSIVRWINTSANEQFNSSLNDRSLASQLKYMGAASYLINIVSFSQTHNSKRKSTFAKDEHRCARMKFVRDSLLEL